jgi:hypothetical protein
MRILVLVFTYCITSHFSLAQLQVSSNGRYLVGPDGKPFFWLGDTAWELFHRLNREDAVYYLKDRASKGFNMIQAVALAELDGLDSPNPYGHLPLKDHDPMQPQEAYFSHVDFIIDEAAKLGIYIGFLPAWGDKIYKDSWGKGPEIFNPANARGYGKWLGQRYANRKNIVWILGGDRNPRGDQDLAIWRAMAAGIEEGTGGSNKALMTFHPQPNDLADGGSSKWFHNDAWLDFNMFQTGHCRENNVWDRITVAYNRIPVKPVLDGETIYEDHPVCFNAKDLGISSAYDVRKNAWFSVFAGSFGHTYGCHDIWQMYAPGREPVNGPHYSWKEALDLPAAGQMRFLRHLMESRPMESRGPAQGLLVQNGQVNDHIQCTVGKGYVMAYSSQGRPIVLRMLPAMQSQSWIAWWYDPRTGKSRKAEIPEGLEQKTFRPPGSGYGQDWVLVLDDASAGYTDPGWKQ